MIWKSRLHKSNGGYNNQSINNRRPSPWTLEKSKMRLDWLTDTCSKIKDGHHFSNERDSNFNTVPHSIPNIISSMIVIEILIPYLIRYLTRFLQVPFCHVWQCRLKCSNTDSKSIILRLHNCQIWLDDNESYRCNRNNVMCLSHVYGV